MTDCVYYATSTDDPEAANPGLKLGATLGTFRAKKDAIYTIAQWQEKRGG